MSPDFPLTFCQNFVEKFSSPSPSPGVHHVWNLSRPPQALPPKKIWAPPDPPRGRYGGSNFQLPPLPPQIPFVRYRKSSAHRPGSTPATIPQILVNLRATQPEIFSLSYWPPAPAYEGRPNGRRKCDYVIAKKLELQIFLTSGKLAFCRAWGPLSRCQTAPK